MKNEKQLFEELNDIGSAITDLSRFLATDFQKIVKDNSFTKTELVYELNQFRKDSEDLMKELNVAMNKVDIYVSDKINEMQQGDNKVITSDKR